MSGFAPPWTTDERATDPELAQSTDALVPKLARLLSGSRDLSAHVLTDVEARAVARAAARYSTTEEYAGFVTGFLDRHGEESSLQGRPEVPTAAWLRAYCAGFDSAELNLSTMRRHA